MIKQQTPNPKPADVEPIKEDEPPKVALQAPPTVALETIPDELFLTITDEAGTVWGELIATLKTFKTGSTGYHVADKVKLPKSRTRFQVAFNMVKIGSKPTGR